MKTIMKGIYIMNFCPTCGNELNENAVVCVKCGTALSGNNVARPSETSLMKNTNTLKLGIILLSVSSLVSILLWIINKFIGASGPAFSIISGLLSFVFGVIGIAGIVLMLVATSKFSKYLSTKK